MPFLSYYCMRKVRRDVHPLSFVAIFQRINFYGKEWLLFWEKRDMNRLITALIINEQNKIQKPVIESTYFKKHVFHTALLKYKKDFILVQLSSQQLKGGCMDFRFINLKRYNSV